MTALALSPLIYLITLVVYLPVYILMSFAVAASSKGAWNVLTTGNIDIGDALSRGFGRMWIMGLVLWVLYLAVVVVALVIFLPAALLITNLPSTVGIALGGIGYILFTALSFWVYSALAPLMAIITIEKKGFGAIGRSWSLTKGHRGGILLAMIALTLLFLVIVGLPYAAIFGLIGIGNSSVMIVLTVVVGIVLLVTVLALLGAIGIFPTVIYHRLLEVKEAGAQSQVVDEVFS